VSLFKFLRAGCKEKKNLEYRTSQKKTNLTNSKRICILENVGNGKRERSTVDVSVNFTGH
jgi:hypothetical protein